LKLRSESKLFISKSISLLELPLSIGAVAVVTAIEVLPLPILDGGGGEVDREPASTLTLWGGDELHNPKGWPIPPNAEGLGGVGATEEEDGGDALEDG
jgi:hypothetical protein